MTALKCHTWSALYHPFQARVVSVTQYLIAGPLHISRRINWPKFLLDKLALVLVAGTISLPHAFDQYFLAQLVIQSGTTSTPALLSRQLSRACCAMWGPLICFCLINVYVATPTASTFFYWHWSLLYYSIISCSKVISLYWHLCGKMHLNEFRSYIGT